ncbi:cupin domain-containing protein [bacterium]|nr:MAG: cupin domain-containing protein [bacterium]
MAGVVEERMRGGIARSEGHTYPGVEVTTYKDEPGTWVSVTRRVLAEESGTNFETRYFEVAPGGYTSFERHGHEHVVIVQRGTGRVRLHDEWSDIAQGDTVHVAPNTPHQFVNAGDEPFGIVCVVDRDRDRPVLLENDGTPRASEEENL